jgi:hypothetical protein
MREILGIVIIEKPKRKRGAWISLKSASLSRNSAAAVGFSCMFAMICG